MLRTRSPLTFQCIATLKNPFDLHVLTTPPAFILSQDQTLRKNRESRILVIHELLLARTRRLAPHILGIMLIGGPNQSHKVNFKEPLPVRGKISKRTFAFCSVNPFPEISEKSFVKERLCSRFLRSPRPRLALVLSKRNRKHANHVFLIKTFLDKKLMPLFSIIHHVDKEFFPPGKS